MKRILGVVVTAGLFAAAPAAFAGVDVFVGIGTPAPPYVVPAYRPRAMVYRLWEPRRHERCEYFERREYREHYEHRRHRGRDWD